MDALREIYERHYQDVFRFALFLTGDRTEADDLAAETFVRAVMARDRIRHDTVRAYLLTITRNLHRDAHRRARPMVALDESLPDDAAPLDVRLHHASLLHDVKTRLRQVAKGDRRALLLFVVREMSYRDIARALGVSVAAVKSRIFRARDVLMRATRDGAAPATPERPFCPGDRT